MIRKDQELLALEIFLREVQTRVIDNDVVRAVLSESDISPDEALTLIIKAQGDISKLITKWGMYNGVDINKTK